MCGEKTAYQAQAGCNQGSPPRMRGKVTGNLYAGRHLRITPACAGKRDLRSRFCPAGGDHPRVCGEKPERFFFIPKQLGSPPRVRGKVLHVVTLFDGAGITPACAGKSCPPQAPTFTRQDHPRLCGEKSGQGAKKKQQVGSPPRMRRKDVRQELQHSGRGITPACAGKSSIQHLTASLGEFEVQKGHPVPHLRQRLQVWPDHARHLRHGLILHASRSAGQGRRLCPGPCPDTAGSGTPRGPSPAKRPHRSLPAATPGGCRAWQSGATAPGSR